MVQNELRGMQDEWLSAKANDIQACADKKDMENFCSALKAVTVPPHPDHLLSSVLMGTR